MTLEMVTGLDNDIEAARLAVKEIELRQQRQRDAMKEEIKPARAKVKKLESMKSRLEKEIEKHQELTGGTESTDNNE